MEYKIFKITYNDGGWHSGGLPYFYYIACNEEEVRANSKDYAKFKKLQETFGGDIWMHEFKGVDLLSEWENLDSFDVTMVVTKKVKYNTTSIIEKNG